MERFIADMIREDEQFVCEAHLHWIYVITGVFWLVGFLAVGWVLDQALWHYFGAKIPLHRQEVLGIPFGAQYPWITFLAGIAGFVIFVLHVVKVIATQIILTNERVIYKTGLVFVDVEDIDLMEIRSEHVDHGILGRWLNYGQLEMDARFVGNIFLPALEKPYIFLKAMQKARHTVSDPLER